MATDDTERDAIARLAELKQQLAGARGRDRRELDRLDELAQTLDGVSEARLAKGSDAERSRAEAKIANAEAALRGIIVPPDPRHPMYPALIGGFWEAVLVVLSFAIPIAAGVLVVRFWPEAMDVRSPKIAAAQLEQRVLEMVFLLGVLGGSVHLITSTATHIGKRDLTRNWIPYYFLLPIQGGALAPIVYLFFRLTVAGTHSLDSLNLYGIYGLAALTGLFSRQAIEALGKTAETWFQRVEAHPGAGSEKSPTMARPSKSQPA